MAFCNAYSINVDRKLNSLFFNTISIAKSHLTETLQQEQSIFYNTIFVTRYVCLYGDLYFLFPSAESRAPNSTLWFKRSTLSNTFIFVNS